MRRQMLGCLAMVLAACSWAGAAEPPEEVPLPEGRALTLSIEPAQETFRARRPVTFVLVLANTGETALKVMPLSELSTHCRINNQEWGSPTPSAGASGVLLPGESVRRKFRVSGVREPGVFRVECTYGMAVSGVLPSARKDIPITR